ncbi:MAG: RNA polymerase sigma factor [Ignavibacteriales bacterium]|nr:RNA polymerase sigma factor [Ignavibacteriales bacterium]
MRNQIHFEQLNELILKANKGDTKAFEVIVRNYHKFGYAVAFKILYNEEDAKDVVQECFIRIWKHLNEYDKKIKFTTWMYKIVVNLCFDKLRSQKRKRNIFKNFDEESVINAPGGIDLEKELTNKELAAIIKHFASGLSEKQKTVFILRDMEDLSIEEVSEIMNISSGSVKTNLFYARQSIRKKIIKWENQK